MAPRTERIIGNISVVPGGYDLSATILKPSSSAFARAPSADDLANSASAATMATDCGLGFWAAASSKNPLVMAFTPSGPKGADTKYLGYWKCRLMPMARIETIVLLLFMTTGIAAATMLVP
ncbi:MAG TPA: hypothetical protein VG758_20925 [Hyphomicrobiaceae bacterium]|nr:hypothetical protein [Hyphomicrobiaceae bacterium]